MADPLPGRRGGHSVARKKSNTSQSPLDAGVIESLYADTGGVTQRQKLAVLEAAASLLEEFGAQALSVKRIAETAGASTQLIYTAFSSKLGVIDALYRHGFALLGEDLAAVPQGNGGIDYVTDLAVVYRTAALSRQGYFEVMFSRVFPDYDAPVQSRRFGLTTFNVLKSAIATCMDAGLLGNEDAEEFTQRFWAAIHGLVSLEVAGYMPKTGGHERYLALVATLLGSQRQPARRTAAPKVPAAAQKR